MIELRKIPEYQNKYGITRDGKVYSYVTNRWLSQHVKRGGYIAVNISKKTPYVAVLVYRTYVGKIPKNYEVEHKNGNSFDNSLGNLRLATRQQNMGNLRKHRGSSKYKGVSWVKRDCKWMASIRENGKSKNLGMYASEEEAALAYNKAAKKVFGEFAFLN